MPCAFHLDRSDVVEGLGDGCQFALAEDQLIDFAGKTWCQFHLPMVVDGKESEKAEWPQHRLEQFNKLIYELIRDWKRQGHVADLSGVVFPADISFEQFSGSASNALPKVLFVKASFSAYADFPKTIFSDDAIFNEATFNDRCLFGGAQFQGKGVFSRVSFSGHTTFLSTKFPHGGYFNGARFGAAAVFNEAHFGVHADFAGAAFASRASFMATQFGGTTEFHGAKFEQNVDFASAQFGKTASFVRASFRGDAEFPEANFAAEVAFDEASFAQDTGFFCTRFQGYTTFEGTNFAADVDFSGDASHSGRADAVPPNSFHHISFRGSKFGGRVQFTNRRFLGTTDFRKTVFTVAPEFHNCDLHQDTDFAGADFQDHSGNDQVDAARAYRTLKLAMEKVRAGPAQTLFFRHEQRSIRLRPDTPWPLRFISFLYELTSDYGDKPMRPFGWLVFTTSIFFIVYAAMVGDLSLADLLSAELRPPFIFTIEQIVRPFAIWTGGYEKAAGEWAKALLCANPILLRLLASIQSLTTFGLIALFLLALRRKFRMV